MSKLRTNFIAGMLLIAPVAITLWILNALFKFLDGISQPVLRIYLGRDLPGVGIILTILLVLAIGYLSSLLAGQSFVHWLETVIDRVPLVSSVYRTVRQVVRGFTSSEGMNFKRTVIVREEKRGFMAIGFLTGEFTVEGTGSPRTMSTVYIPTNHLYLGDIVILPSEEVLDAGMTLEEGISAVLSCGGALGDTVSISANHPRKDG